MTFGVRLHSVNHHYFETWSSNMAYILGFICADGNVYGRTLSIELSNKFPSDRKLLENITSELGSTHPIENKDKSYRLRINSVSLVNSLSKLGIVPNKTKILTFPWVPNKFLRHFLRGFVDADGWVLATVRPSGSKEICVGFCNGSFDFMKKLVDVLMEELNLVNSNLRIREKITPNGCLSITYQLEFYSERAKKIIDFLYNDLEQEDIYLERKYNSHLIAKKFFEETAVRKQFGSTWLKIESDKNQSMNRILTDLLKERVMIPKDIAKLFGISLSTLYRWLDKSKVRIFAERGSNLWTERIISSRKLTLINHG